jgi:hypothetical protein
MANLPTVADNEEGLALKIGCSKIRTKYKAALPKVEMTFIGW